MAFVLIRTDTFVHTCALVQYQEDGKTLESSLRVRFKKLSRTEWDRLVNETSDNDRLVFDVVVKKIEDEIQDGDRKLTDEEAIAVLREDLSLTGQIVEQFIQVNFGAAAKNVRRSRGR
jgi:hypothetical protein